VLKNAAELPVMFEPLSSWCQTKDCQVTYIVSSNYQVQSRDWIGLYKKGYKHWNDYITYVWVSVIGEDMRDGSFMYSVKFEASYLQKLVTESYYLCYYSSALDSVIGYSDMFRLISAEESSESSESDTSRLDDTRETSGIKLSKEL